MKALKPLSLFIIHYSLFFSVALIVACSDWDEHFDAERQVVASQKVSLWENIESRSNLSQFADILRKTGYDKRLAASQTYTVWAPENETFDYEGVLSFSKERMVKEFVENHIARNNYPASGEIDSEVYMLNEKKMHFGGKSTYDIQGVSLKGLNLSSSNGTLHTLNGRMPFLSSIYEALGNLDYPIDSIKDYILSYDEKIINESKSKVGPVVNGEQTYLDTIYYEHNDLLMLFDAYINREDSSYTMVVPTNQAWSKALEKVKGYCNYIPSFKAVESIENKKNETVILKDAEAMKDSVAKAYTIASLFYNNNLFDNKKLKTLAEGTKPTCDSLVTTSSSKMYAYDAANLFDNAKREEMSNGAAWITDSIRIPSWTIWNPELRFEAEHSNQWVFYNYLNGAPLVREVQKQNEEVYGHVSNNCYIELEPQNGSVNPDIYFYLPNVRSTTYNIYIVMVPANINSKHYAGELKPNLMTFIVGYADDEKGSLKQQTFKNIEVRVDSLGDEPGMTDYTSRLDTVLVGEFTFPVSYLGLSSVARNYAPYLRVRSAVSNAEAAKYDRTLRIDCIILRPKELDDYITEHPDYKYDKGRY